MRSFLPAALVLAAVAAPAEAACSHPDDYAEVLLWLDDARLLVNAAGYLAVRDADGGEFRTLGEAWVGQRGAVVSPDGRHAVVPSSGLGGCYAGDGTEAIDASTGDRFRIAGEPRALAASSEGVLVATLDELVHYRWGAWTAPERVASFSTYAPNAMAWTTDGRWLGIEEWVPGPEGGRVVRLVEHVDGRFEDRGTVPLEGDGFLRLDFAPDASALAVGSTSGWIRLLHVASPPTWGPHLTPLGPILALDWGPAGLAAIGTIGSEGDAANGTGPTWRPVVGVLRSVAPDEAWAHREHDGLGRDFQQLPRGLAWSPDGTRLAYGVERSLHVDPASSAPRFGGPGGGGDGGSASPPPASGEPAGPAPSPPTIVVPAPHGLLALLGTLPVAAWARRTAR